MGGVGDRIIVGVLSAGHQEGSCERIAPELFPFRTVGNCSPVRDSPPIVEEGMRDLVSYEEAHNGIRHGRCVLKVHA